MIEKRPRDHSAASTVGGVRVARIFSNVISPPVIFASLGLALAWKELPFWPGLFWAAVYGFWVSLMPILVVVYMLKTGRISDLHMSQTRERRLPYFVSVLGAVIAYVIIRVFDGPSLLLCLALLSILSLGMLAIITTFWLISIHATSIAAADTIALIVFGPGAALLVLPVVVVVSWVRLYLRRHTPAQVFAGLGLGVVSVLVVALLGCFD